MKSKRIAAFIIDGFIIVFLCEIIKMFFKSLDMPVMATFSMALVCILMICKDCYNGMSVGRRITNIQVFDSKTMQVASPAKCVFRNCFYMVFTLEALFVLFNSSGQRIGDYVVHTRVVTRDKSLNKVDTLKIVQACLWVTLVYVMLYVAIYIYASKHGIIQYMFV